MDSMVFADYAISLISEAKKKVYNQWPFNDGFYYEDKDDVEFDEVSSLTGLKVGGVITLYLLNI